MLLAKLKILPATIIQMIKIAYLNPSAEIGGAEKSLIGLLSKLDVSRFKPIVICPKEGPLISELLSITNVTIKIIRIPSIILAIGRKRNVKGVFLSLLAPFLIVPPLFKLVSFTVKGKVKLIHTNGLKAHLVGCVLSAITGVPLIWHVRDIMLEPLFKSIFFCLGVFFPKVIIVNSNATGNMFCKNGKRLKKVVTVYNGIDLRQFTPSHRAYRKIRREFHLNDNQFVIGIVGALTPLKGHLCFLEAASKVIQKLPETKFLIVGDEIYDTLGNQGYREKLMSKTTALKLNDNVVFTGYRNDIPDIMNALDILVTASILPESFGRVLIEGMACAKPVIATNIGGMPEVISDGITGILVEPNNADKLAKAIVYLLKRPRMRQQMGNAGRLSVKEHFSLEQQTKKIDQIYDSIMYSR